MSSDSFLHMLPVSLGSSRQRASSHRFRTSKTNGTIPISLTTRWVRVGGRAENQDGEGAVPPGTPLHVRPRGTVLSFMDDVAGIPCPARQPTLGVRG